MGGNSYVKWVGLKTVGVHIRMHQHCSHTLCPFRVSAWGMPPGKFEGIYVCVSNSNVDIECSIEKGVIEASMTIMEDNTFVSDYTQFKYFLLL